MEVRGPPVFAVPSAISVMRARPGGNGGAEAPGLCPDPKHHVRAQRAGTVNLNEDRVRWIIRQKRKGQMTDAQMAVHEGLGALGQEAVAEIRGGGV